jgi:hypothetical protein
VLSDDERAALIQLRKDNKRLHMERETINKTPIVINRKTTFLAARYHGCLVNYCSSSAIGAMLCKVKTFRSCCLPLAMR